MVRKRRTKSEHSSEDENINTFKKSLFESRKCSCGRPGIGLSKYDTPVCHEHDSFPTNKVKNFPPIPKYPYST
jgi:hypothetical protein